MRLHEYILTGDRTCHFLGCHRQAHRYHHLKEEARWHLTPTPDGITHWTTPTGRKYPKPPDELPCEGASRHP